MYFISYKFKVCKLFIYCITRTFIYGIELQLLTKAQQIQWNLLHFSIALGSIHDWGSKKRKKKSNFFYNLKNKIQMTFTWNKLKWKNKIICVVMIIFHMHTKLCINIFVNKHKCKKCQNEFVKSNKHVSLHDCFMHIWLCLEL